MVSQRKTDANRNNAQKSTGPKTEAGKNKVRFNAVKHGMTARTIVLPHEDADAYAQRLEDWSVDMNPRTRMEGWYVDRMVRISWQIDRADFHERARLNRRIQKMHDERGNDRNVPDLLDRLLSIPKDDGHYRLPDEKEPPSGENACELLFRLRSTAQGCRALLDQWESLRSFLDRQRNDPAPMLPDESLVENCRIVRLLGWRDPESKVMAAADYRVDALLQIQDIAYERMCIRLLSHPFTEKEKRDPNWGPCTPLPQPDVEQVRRLNEHLGTLVEEQCRKLEKLLAEHEEEAERDQSSDEEAAFDDSPEGERLHRYQTHWARMFQRALAEFQDLRDRPAEPALKPGPEPTVAAAEEKKPGPEAAPPDDDANSTKQSHREAEMPCLPISCGGEAILHKATPAVLDEVLGGDPAEMLHSFRAVPRS